MFSENFFLVIFTCTVIISNVQPKGIKLIKRQTEDRWSWGYLNQSQNTTTENPTTIDDQDMTTPKFCSPTYKPPEKPDFKTPERRISEAKCMEYVWELKQRKQVIDEFFICVQYTKISENPQISEYPIAVGGHATLLGEFPHMGAIGWKAAVGTWVFKCGSSLISEKFVLTAAHCTKASTSDTTISDVVPKIVRIGDKNIIDLNTTDSPPRIDAMITRIIVHPQYKPPKKYFDIALIELDHAVTFSKYVQPACLWNKPSTTELGTQAVGTGWGVIESGSLEISPELQEITVDILENDFCDRLLMNNQNRNWRGFMDHQLCAGVLAGGVDSCQGDSGGPLQIKMPLPNDLTDAEGTMSYVIGIISFGVGCAHPNLPGIYTRVSSFIDWIEENVWSNE
ncbi:serine protease snake-like [Plodia interpunctella]|uniref:serine protease snake-like n=1 Tax=Plodia interpunctella TaxID=58824 RepID=UPI002368E585|nr:serine protease snake-like [Plodia interpunctella]